MIVPTGHKILIKPDPLEDLTTTDWGFEIQCDKKLETSAITNGTLVAVGFQAWKAFNKEHNDEPWAKPGDRVIYARHCGSLVPDPETQEMLLIANDDDVVAVITTGENEND